MVPNTSTKTKLLELSEDFIPPDAKPRNFQIVYHNLVVFGYWHIAALYGVFLCFTSAKCATIIFAPDLWIYFVCQAIIMYRSLIGSSASITRSSANFNWCGLEDAKNSRSERNFQKIQPLPWPVQGRRRGLSTELELGELRHNVLIYSLHNKWTLEYRSFCAGSIITELRVLSSAKCFLTNRKKKRVTLNRVRIVAGALTTVAKQPTKDDSQSQQWRSVKKIYSQMFLRFPAYNLCILETKAPWNFNSYVAKIPYATKDLDFDGVCESISLRAIKSWSKVKNVFREQLQMLKMARCEHYLLRSCRLFYATVSIAKLDHAYAETQGAGLICHDTGDPAEEEEGVLVAVTSLVNLDLPSLHNRVGPFHKWITDGASVRENNWLLIIIMILINSL